MIVILSLFTRLFIGRLEVSKKRFSHHECPVARSLDQIGDWWTLLVVREVMYGVHQFNEMRASLGISRAVLTTRLAELTKNGILRRLSDPTDKRAAQYHLTQKGSDLWPVIIALLNWSNQHVLSDSEDVVKPINPASGQPIKALCASDTADKITHLDQMVLRTGTSASQRLSARIDKAFPPYRRTL